MKSNKVSVYICRGTGCLSSGSAEIAKTIRKKVEKIGLKNIQIKTTGCHGFCQRGPLVIIEPEGIFYSEVTKKDSLEIVNSHLKDGRPVERLFYKCPLTGKSIPRYADIPFYRKQQRLIILRNCGHIDPEDIEDYFKVGGYEALKKVLLSMSPEDVIQEITKSGLRGRGGAGFPTGKKWQFCHDSKGSKKYMICNADEGDPGAFMDRSILEADPHSIIEGLIIAGYAIGADEGYIYVRAEYPLAVKRIRSALHQAERKGFLGQDILKTKFNFKVNVMEGAGAFVCGEETALMASIEGKSGRPYPRPPFPAQSGLWGRPTTINNVKTLTSVPVIISKGADWYSGIGTENCKGTAVFAITGNIANCGLVEVAMGTRLRDIIYDIGGGIPGGKKLKAVQTGGPSGGCIPHNMLDLTVDYDSLKAAGSIMGSGGMVVMDETNCMVDVARYFLEFTQKESCGKCVPCRLGTKQMLQILEDITKGEGKPEDIDLLIELGESIKKSALCGLGQTVPNPVLTTIKYFRDEYDAHIKYKKCPAAVCKEIISSPCQHACPIDTEAPVYIAHIARGKLKEAFDIILKDNPLPSVCSRVCHHPCEYKCQAGRWGKPIAIRALKRSATDWAISSGIYPSKEVRSKDGKNKVAIIGSGPAGLTAGYNLANKNYDVTIFETHSVIGGALAVCIPEYRLPKQMLNIDIENIKSSGVKFKTNTKIGKDISLSQLKKDYDAVFIATGANKSRKLNISNEDCDGVIDAMEFLKRVNCGESVDAGKRIAVIGGGNAAVDAARSAARIEGVDEVVLIYRRTRLEMPAFKEEVDALIEEGIKIEFLSSPKSILSEGGQIKGLECIRMELKEADASGRRKPYPIQGSEFVIDLDTLIVAIGESPDIGFIDMDINISKQGIVVVSDETLVTNIEGIFAAGDVVTGPNTVINAMSSGKIAAEMIDKYIRKQKLEREYRRTRPSVYIPAVELTEEEIEDADRPGIPHIDIVKRKYNFNEVDLNLKKQVAIREARRCLRCDLETEDAKVELKTKG